MSRVYRKSILFVLALIAVRTYFYLSALERDQQRGISSDFQKDDKTVYLSHAWHLFFASFSFHLPVLIIDPAILRSINAKENPPVENQNRKLMVAVDKKFKGNETSENDEKINVIHYNTALANSEYFVFEARNEQRAVPRFDIYSTNLVSIPSNISYFIDDWKTSRLIHCQDLINRNSTVGRTIPLSFIHHLKGLADFFKLRGARGMLAGGTLLGWYRECSLISHTRDVDFFVRIEEYTASLLADLDSPDSPYTVSRIYGTVSDSFELTVKVKEAPNVSVDFFFLYSSANESYVGGLDWYSRKKYKWTYPRITSICTADFLGHLFSVPCNVEEILDTEYGKWKEEAHTDSFLWCKSHRNVEENGVFTNEEMLKMRPAGWRLIEDLIGFFVRSFL